MGDASGSDTFLLFGDVHFNPFADPTLVKSLAASDVSAWNSILSSSKQTAYATYGSDTNYALFESALNDMAARAGSVGTIIYPGDVLGHNFNQLYASLTGDASQAGVNSFIQKTVAFFTGEVASRFPNATVILADGNSDNALAGFGARPGDPYLTLAAPVIAANFFKTDADRAAFTAGFSTTGYYAVQPSGPSGIKVIALNDNFWATLPYGDPVAGVAELNWFAAQLAESAATGQKVWVVGHIPVGDNAQTSATNYLSTGVIAYAPVLDNSFNDAFVALETTYASTIAANFAGHTHNDDFRIISSADGTGGTTLQRITPSISPVFGNNPGYQIYTYDTATQALLNETTYTLNLQSAAPAWAKEYDYADTYGSSLATPKDWRAAYTALLTKPTLEAAYANNKVQGAANLSPITAANAPAYLLAPGFVTQAAYNAAASVFMIGLAGG